MVSTHDKKSYITDAYFAHNISQDRRWNAEKPSATLDP